MMTFIIKYQENDVNNSVTEVRELRPYTTSDIFDIFEAVSILAAFWAPGGATVKVID